MGLLVANCYLSSLLLKYAFFRNRIEIFEMQYSGLRSNDDIKMNAERLIINFVPW